MTLIVADDDYEALRRLVDHLKSCRVCIPRPGGAPGLRGCSAGHHLAVKVTAVLDRLTSEGSITADGTGVR